MTTTVRNIEFFDDSKDLLKKYDFALRKIKI